MSDEREQARLARKARRQQAKRRRILEAAREELLEVGLAGFTIASVAERADLSKPAVYYYFESRDALLEGVLVDRFLAETDAVVQAVERAPDGISALTGVLRAFVLHYREDLSSYRVLQTWTMTAGPQTDLLQREIYPMSWRAMGALADKIAADQAEGRVHPDAHPRRLANLAMMLGHGLIAVYASMDALGGETRFDVREMLAEAEATLRRAAESGA